MEEKHLCRECKTYVDNLITIVYGDKASNACINCQDEHKRKIEAQKFIDDYYDALYDNDKRNKLIDIVLYTFPTNDDAFEWKRPLNEEMLKNDLSFVLNLRESKKSYSRREYSYLQLKWMYDIIVRYGFSHLVDDD